METPENNFEVLWVTISHNQCNIIVGVIYHPPKSIYKEIELLTYLETCLSIFNKNFSSSIVILAGDFNLLKNEDIVEHTALLEFVQNPTRGANYLDTIYASQEIYKNIKVTTSTVESDHQAIIAYNVAPKIAVNKSRQVVE